MSRGLGKVERRILEVFQQTAIGLDVSALTEVMPGVSVRGVRRAVQRLERSGQLKATFQPVPHAQQWGGISRVKLDRARQHWQRMERQGYVLLPGVRKRDVYEALL